MPVISIPHSPLVPDNAPVLIHYREIGFGTALVFLHGGWGYEVYPFKQSEVLRERFRILIPDRSGYGRSGRIEFLPTDFHQRAAGETESFLDAMQIERAVLWGHSDGAVIAAMMGLANPSRFQALILEAFHFFRVKEGSREFFETMAQDPERLGDRVVNALAREHGDDYWKRLIIANGDAWLRINRESAHSKEDLYAGRLSDLRVPTLLIHGRRDPRTEPDELDRVRQQLPDAIFHIIENGGHSPHSENSSAVEVTRVAREFLERTII